MQRLPSLLTAVLLVVLGGCVIKSTTQTCSPGATIACGGCPGDEVGLQSCSSDGAAWLACQCACPDGTYLSGTTCVANGVSGNITFLWTFAGQSCAQTPNVSRVQIVLTGPGGVAQSLTNGGLYNCTTAGSDGIQLTDFAPGSYSYTVTGQDSAGTVLYSVAGTVVVNGDVSVPLNLGYVGPATDSLNVAWSFGPTNMSCSAAGVGSVIVKVGSAPAATLPCSTTTGDGVAIGNLAAGNYTIELTGLRSPSSGDQAWFGASASVTVADSGSNSVTVNLPYIASAVTFMPRLRLTATGSNLDCTTAGAATISYSVTDHNTGASLTDAAGNSVDCASGLAGIGWSFVPASYGFDSVAAANYSDYDVTMTALDGSGTAIVADTMTARVIGSESQSFDVVMLPAAP